MFKENPKERSTTDDSQTIIGASVQVEGDFDGKGDVVVEGKLKGNLKTAQNVTVGSQAVIEASIQAKSAHIAGTVKGNIHVDDSLEITKTAKIHGDVVAKIIAIEAGAQFNGNCSTTGSQNQPQPTQNPQQASE